MTLYTIPINPVSSQELTVSLSDQRCFIQIYEKRRYPIGEYPSPALYADLYVNDVLIIGGVILKDGLPIVRDAYLGFIGELFMFDATGTDDPQTAGLGARWFLGYEDGT